MSSKIFYEDVNAVVYTNSTYKAGTVFMCHLYMVVGPMAILANVINVLILIIDSHLRIIQIINITLCIGEIINGASYIMTAYGRSTLYYAGLLFTHTTPRECFFKHYWVVPLIVGTELPAMLVIVLSLERILAVTRPAWFSQRWKTNTKITYIFVVILLQTVSIVIAAVTAHNSSRHVPSRHCTIITSTGKYYSTVHFAFLILAYVFSCISLILVYISTRHVPPNIRSIRSRVAKWQQLRLMIIVTASSVVLVSAPGILMVGLLWNLFEASDTTVAITYSTTGVNSVVTTVQHIILRKEYRAQLGKLFKWQYWLLSTVSNRVRASHYPNAKETANSSASENT